MADSGLRDLGAIVPGNRLAQPEPAPVRAPLPVSQKPEAEPVLPSEPVFSADLPEGADALGLDAPLGLLAELAAHRRTETPLTIGLFGPSGSGKSFALTKLLQTIEELSRAATPASPFMGEIVTLRVDATGIAGNPATALAGVLYSGLAKACPAFAAEAARAVRDPRAAATDALEKVDTARRKLEAEKQALDEISARRVRLAETLLHETAGTQVDAYASVNRPRIKNLLAKLGIAGDPVLAFKDMAGAIAATQSAGRRAGFALRPFFAFKGQTKLIAAAILLFLAGAALGFAFDQQTAWLAWLRARESSAPAANWLEAHIDLLLTLRQIVFLGGALALGINIWRGAQLLRLVFRGAELLQADLAVRRREMNEAFAFRARRVEVLASEVSLLSRRAAEAERRAGDALSVSFPVAEPAPFAVDAATQQAQAFAAAVSAALGKPGETGPGKNGGTPRRIVVALDHLDAVPISRARDILTHAQSLFQHGFAVVIAADSARLAADGSEPALGLDKWIQVPFQIGELTSRANHAALVAQILGGRKNAERQSRDAAVSALDQPVSAAEARLLAGLAPLAGSSARALKRFVNLYRLARTQNQLHKGALAFMLALDAGGTASEIAAVDDLLSRADPEAELDLHHFGGRLAEALSAAQATHGKISASAARHGATAARLFSFRPRGIRE